MIPAVVYKVRNWDPIEKYSCWFDVKYDKTSTANMQGEDEDAEYEVRL